MFYVYKLEDAAMHCRRPKRGMRNTGPRRRHIARYYIDLSQAEAEKDSPQLAKARSIFGGEVFPFVSNEED
ncbi:unnamed protein product [Amoebophrya sp. A25]|nr:unnamed protein product [Amoebophrya sp. A25]|eukprot:GSA25T00020399001.1